MKNRTYMLRREPLLDPGFTITDEDLPVLKSKVDEARFPLITAEGEFFSRYASKEDTSAMIDDLKWLLAEG